MVSLQESPFLSTYKCKTRKILHTWKFLIENRIVIAMYDLKKKDFNLSKRFINSQNLLSTYARHYSKYIRCINSFNLPNFCQIGTIIFISTLWKRKLRHRTLKQFSQGYTTNKWKPGSLLQNVRFYPQLHCLNHELLNPEKISNQDFK